MYGWAELLLDCQGYWLASKEFKENMDLYKVKSASVTLQYIYKSIVPLINRSLNTKSIGSAKVCDVPGCEVIDYESVNCAVILPWELRQLMNLTMQ